MANEASGASQEAISFHYDLGNEFYRLWLDPSMTYSCALFEEGDTLEIAQKRKLDFHLANAEIRGGVRLLDIGCGWGSLIKRARERFPSVEAIGLTLSSDQKTLIDSENLLGVEVKLEDWRMHEPEKPYMGIISIGAMEHFAAPSLSRLQRVKIYRDFFNSCRKWLTPGGCLSVQTIAFDKMNEFSVSKFMTSHIFPESMCPDPSEILEAASGVLSVEYLVNHAQHYAKTCRIWSDRIEEVYDDAVCLVGESKVDDYLRYLKMSASSFSKRGLMLLRIKFRAYPDW